MYSGVGFHSSEIGDVDVIWHDGLFHLFHLVLPNHDYIAHAVSTDGLVWRRVPNALFISNPGGWDDDMLWTMHVTPDPNVPDTWRMLYTGLSMGEEGRVQRVGAARSSDLYTWERVENGYPIEIPSPRYEASADEGRQWVSFRDPFYVRHDGEGYLLAAARISEGPIIRRGCVALAREVAPDTFEFLDPLYHPMRYDDLEVPGVFEIDGTHYLVASIREDVKVHYWFADRFRGPYRNFSDNVLLPQGNYAARISEDPRTGTKLVWNFFFSHGHIQGDHLLPPPKELGTDADGRLRLTSFQGFDARVTEVLEEEALTPMEQLLGYVEVPEEDMQLARLRSDSGFEAFLIKGDHGDYRLSGTIHVEAEGKFGLVMHLQDEGDGYYISIDPEKGVSQIRYWAAKAGGTLDSAFEYEQLQASYQIPSSGPIPFMLISFGHYIELSLNGRIALTLADDRRERGRVGFYLESSCLRVADLKLECMQAAITDTILAAVEPT
jgi:beta-fructofuranosidase